MTSIKKNEITDKSILKWTKEFENPIEIADIIGVFIDNNEKYSINMWISLDDNKAFFQIALSNRKEFIK